jgi:tetratricopeptide (TPR) repeat protein
MAKRSSQPRRHRMRWLLSLVRQLGQAGLGAEAVTAAEALTKIAPSRAAVFAADTALALAEAGLADEARAKAADNLARWPEDFGVRLAAGDALDLLGDRDGALAHFESAQEMARGFKDRVMPPNASGVSLVPRRARPRRWSVTSGRPRNQSARLIYSERAVVPPPRHDLCQDLAVADLDELKIPAAARPAAEEIIEITDAVCTKLLDAEYAELARQAVAKLARKRPSPLLSGRRVTWAAAVVCAVGQVNFVFDRTQEPHLTADELSAAFGVSKSTMSSKAKQVRDMLKMDYFSPEFQRAAMIAQNPAIWFIQVDGLVVDARSVPIEYQVEAYQRGFIPYIPALGPEGTEAL